MQIFDKNQKILDQVESKRFLDSEIERKKRYVPDIDFTKPENFVKYGSAEKYYKDSIERIYKTYPFDGSRNEVLQWKNTSTYLDLYIFENLYPRNTGYISLNSWIPTQADSTSLYQNLDFSGHLNADDTYENPYHVIELEDSQSNVVDSLRGANMKYIPSVGTTIEYWAKCDTKTKTETDIGNGTAGQVLDTLHPYVNIHTKGLSENILFSSGLNYRVDDSGASTIKKWYAFFDVSKFTTPTAPSTDYSKSSYVSGTEDQYAIIEITNPEEWNHFSISTSATSIKVYLNGTLVKTMACSAIEELSVLHGNIGSQLSPNASNESEPGEFSVDAAVGFSIDEFRFWNTARTESQIKKHWWTQVGGGTNTDDANISLGVYYKFNEGIYGESQYDQSVLDYSGRQTDATITNYTTAVRKTSGTPMASEFKDPVIYPSHPDVVSLSSTYESVGRFYDQSNNNKMYNMIPSWISEEDENTNSEVLKNMIQIMSSYLDTLYLQIEKYPEIVGSQEAYSKDNENAETTARNMLQNRGFLVPELFADASVLEKFQHRTDKEKFEKELSVVKDLIYKNIYNNSSNILKSKGTEKSLRNLFRCFGVDEELLKIRVYPVNEDIDLSKPRAYDTTIKKRYADFFSTSENRSGTLFSYGIPSQSTYGVVTGSDSVADLDMSSITFECEAYFPKRYSLDGRDMLFNSILTSSIGGVVSVHDVTDSPDYGETTIRCTT